MLQDETACSSSEILTAAFSNNNGSTSTTVFGAVKRHRVYQRNYWLTLGWRLKRWWRF